MTQLSDEVVEPMVNHREALELAFVRREESNLARCYIELREALGAALAVIDDAGGFDDVPAVQFARDIRAKANS